MTVNILKDAYAQAFANMMILSGPFMTLGSYGFPEVENTAIIVGIICCIVIIVRLIMVWRTKKIKEHVGWLSDLLSLLTLPYACSLSSLISMIKGGDAMGGLWFSLAFAILSVITIFLLKILKKES